MFEKKIFIGFLTLTSVCGTCYLLFKLKDRESYVVGGMSLSHILLLVLVVLIVFGAGKLPQVMGDLAKGVRAFKDGLKDQDNDSKDKNKNRE